MPKEGDDKPILITNPIRNNQIRQILHNRHGGSIHKIQCAAIIRFLEFVFIWQSAPYPSVSRVGLELGFFSVRTCGILDHLCGRRSMSHEEDCRVVRIVWRIRICSMGWVCDNGGIAGVLTYFELAIVMWLSVLYVLDLPRTKIFV